MTGSTIEQWFLDYKQYIYTFLLHYVGPHSADDLLQETFIRAMRGIHNFRGDADPKTWLCRIARNAAIDYLKKNKRTQAVEEFDEVQFAIPSSDLSPHELAEQKELKTELSLQIGELKPNYRDVVVIHGVLEFSIQESAQVLNWTEAKVRVTYHRALKALHHKLSTSDMGGEREWVR